MAKMGKEFQWRMEGMITAYKIVKESGIEGLEKDIRMRNYLKVDIWAKKGEIEQLNKTVSENVYMSMLSTVMFILHDTFGFGKKRLDLMKLEFDKKVENISNLDWMGEHYVRFEDYGIYLNHKYGFDFDVNRIAALQDIQDEQDKRVKRCDVGQVIEELRRNGFNEAAAWLEKKVA